MAHTLMVPSIGLRSKSALLITVTGAPEAHRIDPAVKQVPISVSRGVDVWSLGCLYSEVATWICFGRSRVEQYRVQRQQEVAQKLNNPEDGDLFHDGEVVLNTVEESHTSIHDSHRIDDFITPRIVNEVIGEMLKDQRLRISAIQTYVKSEKAIRAAAKELQNFRGVSASPTSSTRHSNLNADSNQSVEPELPQQASADRLPSLLSSRLDQSPTETPATDLMNGTSDPSQRILSVHSVLKWKHDRKAGLNAHLTNSHLLKPLNDRDLVSILSSHSAGCD